MNSVGRDTRDIARGALTNFAGVLIRSVNVLFYIWLARVHGAAVAGVFIFCQATLDILSKFGLLGFDRGTVTFAARYQAAGDEEGAYRSIAQALAVAGTASAALVVLLEITGPAALRAFGRPDLVEPMRIMAPGVFFWVLTAVLVHAIRATRVMRYEVAVKSIAEPVGVFAAALLLRPLVPGVAGLAWAFLFSTAVGTAVAAALFSRLYAPRRILRLLAAAEGRAEFVRFSSYIGIYDLLNLFLQRVDLLLLNAFGTPVMAGVYGMAQNAAFSFKKVRQSFDPMVIPVIVAAEQRAEPGELLRHFRTVTRWVLVVNLAMLGVATFGSGLIMGIFGREFADGAVPLALLTLAVLMNAVLGVSELFILIDRPALNLVNTTAAILIVVGAGLVLVPRYGMVGAAASLLAGYVVMNIMRLAMVRALYKMQPFTRHHLRALLATAGAGLVAAAAKFLLGGVAPGVASAVALAVFLGAYGGLLALLGLAEEDRALLHRAGARFLRRRGGSARS